MGFRQHSALKIQSYPANQFLSGANSHIVPVFIPCAIRNGNSLLGGINPWKILYRGTGT